MTNRLLLTGAAIACVLLAADTVAGAATARDLYAAALARERTVRSDLSAPQPSPAVLDEVRTLVAEYEALVRRYPASGYSDNALWQAGRLSLDAFVAFHEARDRTVGVRLLRRLAHDYPTSSLVKRVPDQLASVDAADDAPALAQTSSAAAPPAATASAATLSAGPLALIESIHREVLPDVIRVTIEVDREVRFHDERIENPARVFLDLPSTRPAPPLLDKTLRFDGDADPIRQVRVGRHSLTSARVVLEAAGIGTYSVYAMYHPFRLVVDCVRTTAAPPAPIRANAMAIVRPAAPPRAGPPPLLDSRRIASAGSGRLMTTRAGADVIGSFAVDAAAAAPITSPIGPAVAAPPTVNSNGSFSIARQLGLGVSRIVIDPGHGGHDPGAQGKGVTEAELVLDVALRLEKLLQKLPGVDVILTRRTDDFVPLPERTAMANREGADLFLSIHANASQDARAHGVETYFLNFANNLSAAAVAARENAASGQTMGALPDFVKAIALNNKLDESRDFATEVQRTMIARLRGSNKSLKNLGVKQAPFVVLIGAAMPSVLAEISFVTNPQEAKLLRGGSYRQKIAEALFDAIRKYQTSLKNVTTIAHQ